MNAPREFEEIVSAIVDGELAADEVERAVADPEVARRVAEVTAARDLLRDLPPPPDIGRANAVAVALAAAPVPSTPPAPAHAPAPTNGRAGGIPRWLAPVAACLAVLALVAGVALIGRDDNSEDTFAASEDADQGAATEHAETPAEAPADAPADAFGEGDGDDAAGAAPEPDTLDDEDAAEDVGGADRDAGAGPEDQELNAAEESTAAPAWVDLGVVTDGDDLRDQVVAELQRDAPSGGDDTSAHPGCAAGRPGGDPDRGRSELSALAELDGAPVWVQVYPRNDDSAHMVATDRSCDDIVDRIISP